MAMSGLNSDFLIIDGVSKTYGVVKALDSISFSVRQGEIHTILGENGAGKSTLVKIIMGEEIPDKGTIRLDGEQIRTFTPAAAHAMGIYMVHQELAVFENLTVADNIYPSQEFRKGKFVDYKALYQETRRQLERFGLKTIRPGDRVLVHAGCILQKMEEQEADDLADLFAELEAAARV